MASRRVQLMAAGAKHLIESPIGASNRRAGPEQFRAGRPGHRHGIIRAERAGQDPGLGSGQAAAPAPRRDLGVPASFTILRGTPRTCRRGYGLSTARVLARVPSGTRLASFIQSGVE